MITTSKNKTEIRELMPSERAVPLENLYLGQNIRHEAERSRRPIVYTNYISDLDDVIAVKDENGIFRVPKALRNPGDWRLFQELEAQSDVIITSRAYLNRLSVLGDGAQNVLTQFEPGGEFDDFGTWRLRNGFASRSPDIAIVGRVPDIILPESLLREGSTIIFFTTYDLAKSAEAKRMQDLGIIVAGAGVQGVEGKVMIDYLAAIRGYRTMYMLTGPSIFSILVDAGVLDRLYLTRVHRTISVDDPSSVIRIRHHGKKITELNEFMPVKKYRQVRVITEDNTVTSQEFLIYEKIKRKK